MASLGSLVIELAANTARLSSDMGKAVGIAQRTANQLSGAFKGIAGGLIGATLLNTAKQAIELGDNLGKASIKAGVSGQAISELAYAAKQSDIDLQALSGALQKMQVALSKAASGSKEQNAALAALGLTLKDIQSLSPDRQFELLADRISQLRDPADRARAAVDLFGKSGADLLPLFEQGAAGIRKAREEAQRLGLSFSGDQLKALGDADDAIKRLSQSWTGFATVLISKVAPAITTVLDGLSGATQANARAAQEKQLPFLNARLGALQKQRNSIKGPNIDTSELDAQIRTIKKKIDDLLQPIDLSQLVSRRVAVPGFGGGGGGGSAADGLEVVVRSARRSTSAMEEFYDELDRSTRTSIENQLAEYARLEAAVEELVAAGRITREDANRRVAEGLDSILKEVEVTAKKTKVPLSEMSEFAKQAARNMQDAFADFLFDPFKDGIRGMLKGFVDILRRMAAEALAAKIFDQLGFGKNSGGSGGGGGGLGDIFKGFASLFGFANGGSFKVGGSGGTDSQLVAFKASPNETVTVTRPDQRMGGGGFVFAPVYNIAPGSGVTEAQVRAISRDAAIEGLRRYNDMAQRNGMRPVKF